MRARSRLYRRMRQGMLLAVATLACAWLPLHAATPATPASSDPPAQVARISWLAGDVSLLPANGDQWQAVDVNRPLTTGDELATAPDARVELQMGSAIAHLDGSSDFRLLALGQWQTQLALTQGTAEVNVHSLPDGEYVEIDTPQVAVVIDRSARVRVDLGADNTSTVTVWRGAVVVHGQGGAQQVLQAGDRYRYASPTLAGAEALTIGDGDAFDHWVESRDMLLAGSQSGQYVAPGTVGYQDLDQYGDWQAEPDYGEVWYPNDVAADWVPYRNGRWVSVAPWGMTWVSYEPWGFAPFHYGRWAVIGGRWGWVPGMISVRAVYAPALVGFFGGSGWNVSVGLTVGVGGLFGWYPLGPGMIYNPWYSAGWGYYSRINHYGHRYHYRDGNYDQHVRESWNAWRQPKRLRPMRFEGQAPQGITVVSRHTLERGRDMGKGRLHLADSQLRNAPLRDRGLDITPRPLRSAAWQPARALAGSRRPVVALHRPESMPVAALRNGQAARTALRHEPVRMLTADARTGERPVERAVPPDPFRGASSRSAVRVQRPLADDRARINTRQPPPPVAAVRGRGANVATLPDVPRLEPQASTRGRPMPDAQLPRVTRLRPADALLESARRTRDATPATPRWQQPRPIVQQRTRRTDAIASPPSPAWESRPRVERSSRTPEFQPRPVFERNTSRPQWRTVAPRPAPVQRSAPVRWESAPAVREQRATPFRAQSRPAVRSAPSSRHAGKSYGRTEAVRHKGH